MGLLWEGTCSLMEEDDNSRDESKVSSLKERESTTKNVCPVCGSSNIVLDRERGEVTCGNCGTQFRNYEIDGMPKFTLRLKKGKGYIKA